MKKTLFLTALCAMSISLFIACDKDDSKLDEDDKEIKSDEEGSGNGDNNNGNQNNNTPANFPNLFVYYPGANFIYKRTVSTGLTEKLTWTVTDYNEQTKTATVQTQYNNEEPSEMQIRSLSNGMIEFSTGSGYKSVVNDKGEVGYMFNYRPSIPSGIYGSLTDKYEVVNIAVPGGKSSAGVTIGASYQPYTGFHDSYLWDWQMSESWCSECGFVRSSSYWSNGKEYPISSSRSSIELLAYDIPMPDGTRRSYIPAGCETYDVTDTYCTYFHLSANTQRYDDLSFYWNDKKNQNVMRYNLYMLWYDEGWTYGQVQVGNEDKTEFSGWFKGKETTGRAIGGHRDAETFDCAGYYRTWDGSARYFPEGYYVYFVMVENIVNVGVPSVDDTEFVLICIDYEHDCVGSDRVELLDDGTVDYYGASQNAQTRASVSSPIRVSTPDPSLIIGPVHKLR